MFRSTCLAAAPLLMLAACAAHQPPGAGAPASARPTTPSGTAEAMCPRPTYPTGPRLAGLSGQTVIEYFVTADGTITQARVAQSSGSEDLDQLARFAVLACRGATPGTVKGVPTAMWGRVTYEWRLE